MSERIAIIGIACRYPEADNPKMLWENLLAQRRAFRRVPQPSLRRDPSTASPTGIPAC